MLSGVVMRAGMPLFCISVYSMTFAFAFALPQTTSLLLLLELGVVLLEALAQALRHGHVLLDAARHAARLAARQRLGGEVVDTRDEAVVYEVAKELFFYLFRQQDMGGQASKQRNKTYTEKLLDLSLLHALLELARFGLRETVLYVYISVNLPSYLSISLSLFPWCKRLTRPLCY